MATASQRFYQINSESIIKSPSTEAALECGNFAIPGAYWSDGRSVERNTTVPVFPKERFPSCFAYFSVPYPAPMAHPKTASAAPPRWGRCFCKPGRKRPPTEAALRSRPKFTQKPSEHIGFHRI
jgi:hypothetical protein